MPTVFAFMFSSFSFLYTRMKTPWISVSGFSLILIHVLQATIRLCSSTWSPRRRAWLLQTPALSSTTAACTSRKSMLTSLTWAKNESVAAEEKKIADFLLFDAFCLDASHVWAVLTSATGVNTDTTVPMTHAHAPSKRDESRSLRSVSLFFFSIYCICIVLDPLTKLVK